MFGTATNNSKSSNQLAALLGYGNTKKLSEEKLRELNFDYLRVFSNYLIKQKKAEKIDEKEFSLLMRVLGANFVENELDIRIRRLFRGFF